MIVEDETVSKNSCWCSGQDAVKISGNDAPGNSVQEI
jgi:hypothetical protein